MADLQDLQEPISRQEFNELERRIASVEKILKDQKEARDWAVKYKKSDLRLRYPGIIFCDEYERKVIEKKDG